MRQVHFLATIITSAIIAVAVYALTLKAMLDWGSFTGQ